MIHNSRRKKGKGKKVLSFSSELEEVEIFGGLDFKFFGKAENRLAVV